MIAARALASRRMAVMAFGHQRRFAQTVPRAGPESQMVSDAVEQIRARVQRQKEIFLSEHVSHAEEVDEMWKWVKISLMVMIPICILSSFKDIIFGEEHGHRHEGHEPDYMHIRAKEFPWTCGDCDLFDMPCWKKCKAEIAES